MLVLGDEPEDWGGELSLVWGPEPAAAAAVESDLGGDGEGSKLEGSWWCC